MCMFKKLTIAYFQFHPPSLSVIARNKFYLTFTFIYSINIGQICAIFALDSQFSFSAIKNKKNLCVYFHLNHFQRSLILCINLSFCLIFFLPEEIPFIFCNAVCAGHNFIHLFFI